MEVYFSMEVYFIRKWMIIVVETWMAYLALYVITFLIVASLFYFLTSEPMDENRISSGIIAGFAVSTIPFVFLGVRMHKTYPTLIHQIAIVTLAISVLVEKLVPLFVATLIKMSDPLYSNRFSILSEELPYFSFGYIYIFASMILGYLSFYLGVRIVKVDKVHSKM